MSKKAQIAGVKGWKLWFALLGGAVAWTLHLLLAYAIAEFGCVAGWDEFVAVGISLVSWLLIGVSVAMTALAAGALAVSWDAHRKSRRVPRNSDDRATLDYTARFGLITNGLFLFIILVESVPIFFYRGSC